VSEHTCTFYCQDGLHVYECLCPLADAAADVLQAARLWVAHMGWPDEVVQVQPARESDAAQILRPSMVEVSPHTQTVRDVTPTWVDITRYRPWLVFLRAPAADDVRPRFSH
jgi:hypothetical protein